MAPFSRYSESVACRVREFSRKGAADVSSCSTTPKRPGMRRPNQTTATGVWALPAMMPGRKIASRSNPTARTARRFETRQSSTYDVSRSTAVVA